MSVRINYRSPHAQNGKRQYPNMPGSRNYQQLPVSAVPPPPFVSQPGINPQIPAQANPVTPVNQVNPMASSLTGKYYGLGDVIAQQIVNCAQGGSVANRSCLIDPTNKQNLRNQMTPVINQIGASQTKLTGVQQQTLKVNLNKLADALVNALGNCSNQANINLIEQCINNDPGVQSALIGTQSYLQSVGSQFGGTRLDESSNYSDGSSGSSGHSSESSRSSGSSRSSSHSSSSSYQQSSATPWIWILVIFLIVLFIAWIFFAWRSGPLGETQSSDRWSFNSIQA